MVKAEASSADQLLKGLNPAQKTAVKHTRGPALVLAGAGTGKTKVITTRIAYLIEKDLARSEQILALTFTDKAATEMEERVDRLLPYGYVDTQIMTFHALGSSLIQDFAVESGLPPQVRLASPLQQHALMRHCLEELSQLSILRPDHNPHQYISQLLQYISRLKDEGISVVEFTKFSEKLNADQLEFIDPAQYKEVARIYKAYEDYKLREGFIDFGDQLLIAYQLLDDFEHVRKTVQARYKYILVDEFQDTNSIQARLLYRLAGQQQNLMVVGDDDQAIYRFRGAELQNILEFKDKFPAAKSIVLTENYRSTQQIIDTSYSLIQHNNPQRLEVKLDVNKRLRAQTRGENPQVKVSTDFPQELSSVIQTVQHHLKTVPQEEIAILARSNKQVAMVSQALEQKGVAVGTTQSARLLHQPVVRQCVDFLRVLHDPHDSSALYRYLMAPKFTIDAEIIMATSAAARRENSSLAEYIDLHNHEVPDQLVNQLRALEGFRKLSKDQSAGEVLYAFITSDSYLDKLVVESQEDLQASHSVQSLASFFRLIGELEELDGLRDTEAVWSHIQDMYALSILSEPDETDQKEGVQVMTIHKAKGLEFKVVCIFDTAEGSFPSRRHGESLYLPQQIEAYEPSLLTQEHIQEERRLCYVAMTRAKEFLYLSYSQDHGGKRVIKPSRFLVEAFGDALPDEDQVAAGHPVIIDSFAPGLKEAKLLTYPENQDGWMQLTPNQLADYTSDPYRFYVHSVLQFPQPPSHSLVYGTAIHGALEFYFREKLAGNNPSQAKVLNVFQGLWKNQGFVSQRHQLERLTAGEKTLTRLWEEFEANPLKVVAVEEPFELKLENLKVKIKGRIDLLLETDKGLEVRDFKTSAVANERYAQERVRDNLPIHIYAMAMQRIREQPVSQVSLHFVDTNILAIRSNIDNEKTMKKISEAVTGIRNNIYPAKSYFTNLEIEDL